MSDNDLSLLDLPSTRPVDDPDAYLRAAIRWHFSPETGSPFWLRRAASLGFDPLTEVTTFADLARFPNVVDELRDVDVHDLVPAGYGPTPPAPQVFESGGTTGAPKRVIVMPDWDYQGQRWEIDDLGDDAHVRGRGLLLVTANGPHAVGYTQRRLAEALQAPFHTVDFDPRWVKKLIARGAAEEVSAYVDHIVDQAGYVLRSQDIGVMMTTPPLLSAMARHDELVDAINDKVSVIKLGGAHLDEDTRALLPEIFPKARVLEVYGSTMVVGQVGARTPRSIDDPVVFDGRSPYITWTVIDAQTGEQVPYGERGQVLMNHVSKAMFLPNNLERDTAIRMPTLDGAVGDALSDIAPVATFGGEAVIEGVY